MAKKIIPIIVILILVVGGGAFYGGMKYKENRKPSFQVLTPEQRQQFEERGMQRRTGETFLSGEVIDKDEQSLTLKMSDGSSKIIFFSDSTEIVKFVNGNPNELEAGTTVVVNGKVNQDGSITAQSIQMRPEGMNLPPQ